jgi:AcrR family transcriptional regulator
MTIDLREKIMTEAATRFVASGYHAVSMREIAESVGASKAAIYYYFADKRIRYYLRLWSTRSRN